MENLLFTIQENKQFKRQIQILNYLKQVQIPVSATELSRELECSLPTLRSDIQLLNATVPENIQITWLNREGYKLTITDSLSIESCLAQLTRKTTAFQIIDNIFHQKIYSFDHATELLFLSPNTLRKVLQHLNQVLKPYHVAISTKRLDFVGSESDIRLFLFTFYSNFRESFKGFSTDKINKEAYIELLVAFQKAGLPQLHISHFKAAIWIMVIKNRLLNKKFITLNQKLMEEVQTKESFQLFYKFFRFSFNYSFITDTSALEEVIWCYLVCLHCVSYYDSQKLKKHKPCFYQREASPLVDGTITTFLKNIFPSEMFQDNSLKKMQAFLNNLYFLSQLTPQFEQVSAPLKKFIKESSGQIYSLWYDQLKTAVPKHLFPIHHLEDVAITLTMLHLSIIEKAHDQKVRVLFSFQGEAGYDDYLVQFSKQLLTKNISAEYYFEKMITKQMIKEKKIDLVVCNYELATDALPCQTFHLSYIPTSSEWDALAKTFQKMVYFKEKV